ncbi:sialate O-acetylesterase [bacterium]|nr:sialate O-acetylesterase [Akkermansiaceae bacterium]MDA7663967.1 sialate O-acetylesterase [bacterium]MDB4713620.1 sialate O-acetylesterase [Akkermansiaceae bacterium]
MKSLISVSCFAMVFASFSAANPLKVYILAGQSNMEGHAKLSSFDHIGMDPKTAPILKEMRGGEWRTG